MMGARPVLERFDAGREIEAGTSPPAPPVPPATPDLPQPDPPAPALAAAAPDSASQEAAADLCAALSALEHLLAETAHRRARLEAAIAEAVAGAVAEVLPQLARSGFPGEVAAACQALLRAPRAAAELRVAPDLVSAVEAALATSPAAERPALTITPDATLTQATARLLWPEGGAELDAARLAETAQQHLRARLDAATVIDRPTEENTE